MKIRRDQTKQENKNGYEGKIKTDHFILVPKEGAARILETTVHVSVVSHQSRDGICFLYQKAKRNNYVTRSDKRDMKSLGPIRATGK